MAAMNGKLVLQGQSIELKQIWLQSHIHVLNQPVKTNSVSSCLLTAFLWLRPTINTQVEVVT